MQTPRCKGNSFLPEAFCFRSWQELKPFCDELLFRSIQTEREQKAFFRDCTVLFEASSACVVDCLKSYLNTGNSSFFEQFNSLNSILDTKLSVAKWLIADKIVEATNGMITACIKLPACIRIKTVQKTSGFRKQYQTCCLMLICQP